jgi:hypothetical protein
MQIWGLSFSMMLDCGDLGERNYHGHYDPVDFAQDDFPFRFEFFA